MSQARSRLTSNDCCTKKLLQSRSPALHIQCDPYVSACRPPYKAGRASTVSVRAGPVEIDEDVSDHGIHPTCVDCTLGSWQHKCTVCWYMSPLSSVLRIYASFCNFRLMFNTPLPPVTTPGPHSRQGPPQVVRGQVLRGGSAGLEHRALPELFPGTVTTCAGAPSTGRCRCPLPSRAPFHVDDSIG